MSTPTPDASTPEGRFLTAYGCWQHARMTAGMAMLTSPPAQKLALATNMVQWTVELDQAWEQFEGPTYTHARDSHPARGVLSALRVVRERVGVLAAVELTEDGPMWQSATALGLGTVDGEVYDQHLGGRGLFDLEESVLDLLINSEALADGRGRQALEQAASPSWEVGEQAPHEEPEMDEHTRETLAAAMEEINMFSTHTPEEIEAYHAQRGGHFLTLVVSDKDENYRPGQVEDPLGAWHAIMRQVNSRSPAAMTMGGTNPTYLFKGEYAKHTVHELAQVARILNPGHWEIVEGYRPASPPSTEQGGQ